MRIEQIEQQVQLLAATFASSRAEAALTIARPVVDDAAATELAARLGELTAQLAARTPTNAADAVASRGDTAPDATHTASILALRDGLSALDTMRAVCAENLANVYTPGWKRRAVDVTTALDAASGLQLPRVQQITTTMTTGTLECTERALDVAIDGDGFFAALRPDGTIGYTRAGNFQVDAEGRLVTSSGAPVQPQITFPNDMLEVSIDPVGNVTVRTAGSPDTSTRLGQLTLTRFVAPDQLAAAGDNLMRVTDAAGSPITGTPGSIGIGTLKAGCIERSNVQSINELVNLQLLERQRSTLVRALAGFGVYVR